ncbi:hypothetical protein RISW2_05420 [Roseivivax isoporae LMG 25204]|uniref:Soluble ligand binding domain-containing protein n=1 Tax=Roseivivax isoporae LMG 25204 TaxID=1449351 RepID=X7F7F2_9RHOB|nr:hypothetical protein RISW2_05420 [Roseivivax isoporae LMG 25204]
MALAALVWLAGALPALAEITVERGDVLRVDVLNAPDFSRDAPVDADGRIALPNLGALVVAGRPPHEIRDLIAGELESRRLVHAPLVLVEVAAYRPVYVGGAVESPGAVDYTPGLTARQAVIAAGGLQTLAPRAAGDTDALDAIVSRRSVALALAQVEARIARLQAELDGAASLPGTLAGIGPEGGLLPEDTARAVIASEESLLSDRRSAREAADAHAVQMQALIAGEIDTLSRQAELQEQEEALQLQEIEDARSLVEKGLMPRPRLQEMLRERSQLSRDRLETASFVARARQMSETLRFELERDRLRRREDIRLELQETLRSRAALSAELEALDIRVVAYGMSAALPEDMPEPAMAIHRTRGDVTETLAAAPDAPLLPGDVLEITMARGTGRAAASPAGSPPSASH